MVSRLLAHAFASQQMFTYLFLHYAPQAIILPRALSTTPTPRTVGNYSSSQAVLFFFENPFPFPSIRKREEFFIYYI